MSAFLKFVAVAVGQWVIGQVASEVLRQTVADPVLRDWALVLIWPAVLLAGTVVFVVWVWRGNRSRAESPDRSCADLEAENARLRGEIAEATRPVITGGAGGAGGSASGGDTNVGGGGGGGGGVGPNARGGVGGVSGYQIAQELGLTHADPPDYAELKRKDAYLRRSQMVEILQNMAKEGRSIRGDHEQPSETFHGRQTEPDAWGRADAWHTKVARILARDLDAYPTYHRDFTAHVDATAQASSDWRVRLAAYLAVKTKRLDDIADQHENAEV